MVLATYVHCLNPFMIEFWDGFGIRWYGMAYLAGFAMGFGLIYWAAQRRLSPMQPQLAGDFVFAMAISTLAGGRVGYCLFYQPSLLWQLTAEPPFWGVLAIHQGGMASHGGMIGLALGCWWFARRHDLPMMHLLDLVAITGPIGVVFGRIANFINGELYGRACSPDFAWAVKFPQEMVQWENQPAKLEALTKVVVANDLATQSEWQAAAMGMNPGLVRQVINELMLRAQDCQSAVHTQLAPLLTARHPSQLYQAVLEGLLVVLALIWIWRKPRKPGVIAGCFIMGYAIARIVGEQFRMPDAHIGYDWLGLTRGQWLSVVMFLVGVATYVWCRGRDVDPLGGWASAEPSTSAKSDAKPASP